jgi:DNA-binding response OmpR family regulator
MKGSASPDSTILILDSYHMMRTALCEVLQDAGYLVMTASELGAAVEHLNDVHPDLLIIPPYIDYMAGYTAADYLRTKEPGLRVLMIAGFIDDDRIRVQNEIREFFTFPGPFSRDELLAKVRSCLWDSRKF